MKLKSNKKIITFVTLFSVVHAPLAMSMHHNQVHPEEIVIIDTTQQGAYAKVPNEVIFEKILPYLDNETLIKTIKLVCKDFYAFAKKQLEKETSTLYMLERYSRIFSHILRLENNLLFVVKSETLTNSDDFSWLPTVLNTFGYDFLSRTLNRPKVTLRLLAEPLDHNLDIIIKTKVATDHANLNIFFAQQHKESMKKYKKRIKNKKRFIALFCLFLILSPIALAAQIILTPYLLKKILSSDDLLGPTWTFAGIETALVAPHALTCFSWCAFLNACRKTKNYKTFFKDFFKKIEEFAEKNPNLEIDVVRTPKIQ